MKNAKTLRKLLLSTTILILSSVLAASIYTRASKSQQKEREHPRIYNPTEVTSPPEVKSDIKGLQIASVTLINQGTQAASILIELINNRDEAVMALDFISGKNDRSAMSTDGLLKERRPQALSPPHSL